MRKAPFLLLLLGAVLLSACSDLNRAMKSRDMGFKLATATKYFNAAEFGTYATSATKKQRRQAESNYERALPLLEELIALTRGDTTFERVSYMYAKSYYGTRDYILGGYYLENFAKTFPASKYAAQCAFLSAMCSYRESPDHALDQESTQSAIDQFQLFLVRHPDTDLKDSCNTIIDKLRAKLELKDFENAMLYVKTRNYAPASLALDNYLKKWPNSPHREEVLYNILLCDHDLAMNSVDYKKADRVATGIRSFDTFADAFPQSPRLKDAQRLKQDLLDLQEHSKRTTTP